MILDVIEYMQVRHSRAQALHGQEGRSTFNVKNSGFFHTNHSPRRRGSRVSPFTPLPDEAMGFEG